MSIDQNYYCEFADSKPFDIIAPDAKLSLSLNLNHALTDTGSIIFKDISFYRSGRHYFTNEKIDARVTLFLKTTSLLISASALSLTWMWN